MVQHSLVGPMKEFSTIFPVCTEHIKAREKALQEYAKVQVKLEKLQEKENTASNSVKVAMVNKKVISLLQVLQT